MTVKKRKAATPPRPKATKPAVAEAAAVPTDLPVAVVAPIAVPAAPAAQPLPVAPAVQQMRAETDDAVSADEKMVKTLEQMLRDNPTDGGTWSTLGVILRRLGKMNEALICHARGLEYDRGNSGIWSNLANVLTDVGRYDEALDAHAQAVRLAGDNGQIKFNAIVGRRKSTAFRDALLLMDEALARDPGSHILRWERALTLLQIGDYEQGLSDYESRKHIPSYRTRITPGTGWDGGPLQGKRIFLSTEQGFGDTLMAARYVPLVKAQGGRVLFECHPELRSALAALPIDEFVPAGSDFPRFDVHASQMSLPYLCRTRFDSVPPPVQLDIPPEARAKAARLIPAAEPGIIRVGIIWSGRVTFADNARRATTLSRFLRFGTVPGVRLYSVQKGPPEDQLDQLASRTLVTPLGPHIDDFADTAALLERLDLLIMTDSSTAHLAGSLGTPVWNLVQYMPYWIYGDKGSHTPWYPSMRLFRQGRDEDWEAVFEAALAALRDLAAGRAIAARG